MLGTVLRPHPSKLAAHPDLAQLVLPIGSAAPCASPRLAFFLPKKFPWQRHVRATLLRTPFVFSLLAHCRACLAKLALVSLSSAPSGLSHAAAPWRETAAPSQETLTARVPHQSTPALRIPAPLLPPPASPDTWIHWGQSSPAPSTSASSSFRLSQLPPRTPPTTLASFLGYLNVGTALGWTHLQSSPHTQFQRQMPPNSDQSGVLRAPPGEARACAHISGQLFWEQPQPDTAQHHPRVKEHIMARCTLKPYMALASSLGLEANDSPVALGLAVVGSTTDPKLPDCSRYRRNAHESSSGHVGTFSHLYDSNGLIQYRRVFPAADDDWNLGNVSMARQGPVEVAEATA
ncbi:hypothetical protein H8959_007206 [Pygathrix nigripes]